MNVSPIDTHLYILKRKSENTFVETRSSEKEFIENLQQNWTSNIKVVIFRHFDFKGKNSIIKT